MSNVVSINVAQQEQQKKVLQLKIMEHLTTLRRFSYSLTQNMQDADDLAQNVIEKMMNAEMPEHQEFLPWMFRICKNAWIDEIRSRKIRQPLEKLDPDDIPDTEDPETPESEALKQDLVRAIETLPEGQRIVLKLVVIGGLTYQECAETLGIPIGSVMSRISRARCKLADRLKTKN